MDYFALDKNDQLNKARKKNTRDTKKFAHYKMKRFILYIILLMQLYWDVQEENKKKCKNQINNRKIHAEKEKYFNEQSEIICNA